MIKMITVAGPTASGKTKLAIQLAKKYGGEIVSCDSMQIYRKMDIGTAKPDIAEMDGIKHHMIDICDSKENYSCADFCSDAKKVILDIDKRGKIPILCGGTGLYIDHLLGNTVFSEVGKDDSYRSLLEERIKCNGIDDVYSELCKTDPESAAAIHKNNVKRVIRALEIFHLTGKTKSEWDRLSVSDESEYDNTFIFLNFSDRNKLYERIDRRVDLMMEKGLVTEVKQLYENGLLPDQSTASQAIGYKEIVETIKKGLPPESASDIIKQRSRNYAKRQITWFKRRKNVKVINVDQFENYDDMVKYAENFIEY